MRSACKDLWLDFAHDEHDREAMRDAAQVQALLAAASRRRNLQRLDATLDDSDQQEQLAILVLLAQRLPQLRRLFLNSAAVEPTHLLPLVGSAAAFAAPPPPG